MLGKKAKARRLAQKQEAETLARAHIKSVLNKMRFQSNKLDQFKKSYIDKAKQAILYGNKDNYELAKSGLKICLAKQRFIESMITHFELSLQLTDMNKVVSEFFEGLNIISSQMQKVTSGVDMAKAKEVYDRALASNEGQYEALSEFIQTANESIQSFDGSDCQISDDEIDKLISNKASDEVDRMDAEIDSKIADLRLRLGE